jgi:hypothetical protein
MADILDRTVTITLKAVNDAYTSAIQNAAKITDDAVKTIQETAAGASKSFDTLSTSVASTGTVASTATQSTAALSKALDAANESLAKNAAATTQAASGNQAIATSSTQAATAEKAISDATAKTTDAVKSQAAAAADASTKIAATGSTLQDTATKAAAAGDSVKGAGEKTSIAGGFFGTLKDKIAEASPGLGKLTEIAGGVATGMAGLQIAEVAAGWLVDVGKKALDSSGQLGGIEKTFTEVQEAIEGFVGRGIQALFSALSALGPIFNPLIEGIEELFKWLSAFGDWLSKSGTLSAVFQTVLATLKTLFAPVIQAAQDLWKAITDAFSKIQQILQDNPAIWQAALAAVAFVVTNLATELKVVFAVIGLAVQGVVALVKLDFELLATGIGAVVDGLTFVWDKLKAAVAAVGDVFHTVFNALPGPVADAFKAVAQTIANWVGSIVGFVSGLIDKIPGLQGYKSTFDSISSSLLTWGKTIADGTSKQKAANDAAEEAATKAKALAAAQQQVGIMTKDATDKAVAGALAQTKAWDTLKDSGTQSLAALAVGAKNTYQALLDTQTKTAATATDTQKQALAQQIAAIQQWATVHHVALTDAVADTAELADAIVKTNPFLDALTERYKQFGLATQTAVIELANQSQLAWETFTTRQQHSAEETTAFIQLQYEDLEKQVDAAREAGYTNEVARIESMQAQVAKFADAAGIKLKSVTDAYNAITKSIEAIAPASDDATRAISGMADKSLEASAAMANGMDQVAVRTDKSVQAQLDSITNGYKQQIAIAGTSAAEQARIAQDYYAKLKDLVAQSGDTWGAAEQQKFVATRDAMQKATDAVHVALDKTKQDTQDTTEQLSMFWQNFGKAADKAVRQAASSMADALVNGDKSFGETCKAMLKDLEKAFLQTFINVGLKSVTTFIENAFTGKGGLLSVFSDTAKQAQDLGKTISSSLPMMSTPSGLTDLGNLGGGAGSAGSGASGILGALGGVGGAINVVSGAVSAISGVLSYFAERGQTKVLENIQDVLLLIYGQLVSVVAPTLQTGLMFIANYELHFWTDWEWKWVAYFTNWEDRLFSTVQATGKATVNAVAAWGAAIVQAVQQSAAAAGAGAAADATVAAINTQGAAIVQAVGATATAIGDAVSTAAAGAPILSLDPVVTALKSASDAITAAIGNAATATVNAIAGIGSIPATITNDGSGTDLSPITTLLQSITTALTQGSLRPNVQLNVESTPAANDIANTIVRQLQLQGVIR